MTRTVDAMGNVGVSIRGAEPRHTLIMVDGHPVLGDVAKYRGAGDEVMRLGAENIDRIEIIRGAASVTFCRFMPRRKVRRAGIRTFARRSATLEA